MTQEEVIRKILNDLSESCLKDENEIDYSTKILMKDKISLLSKQDIINIFQILVINKAKYTRKNNGIFININGNGITTDVLLQIKQYIDRKS